MALILGLTVFQKKGNSKFFELNLVTRLIRSVDPLSTLLSSQLTEYIQTAGSLYD